MQITILLKLAFGISSFVEICASTSSVRRPDRGMGGGGRGSAAPKIKLPSSTSLPMKKAPWGCLEPLLGGILSVPCALKKNRALTFLSEIRSSPPPDQRRIPALFPSKQQTQRNDDIPRCSITLYLASRTDIHLIIPSLAVTQIPRVTQLLKD